MPEEVATISIHVPQLPDSVTEASVAALHVQNGQAVVADQVLLDIETDKVVLEVVAPSNGVIERISVEPGEIVNAQQTVMRLRETQASEAELAELSSNQQNTQTTNEAHTLSSENAGVTLGLMAVLVILIAIIVGLFLLT